MFEFPKRDVDFKCPFAEGEKICPETLSPMREIPSHRERKLFVLMNRAEAPTKNACPHCTFFIETWKRRVWGLGHIRYLLSWLQNKELRKTRPLESLQRGQ